VHLLSVFHVGEGRTLAQREVGEKTNEIPELSPCIEGLDLAGMVVTLDALHTQRETARLLREDKGAHYLMIVKANQTTLLEQVTDALQGTDADFARASWTEEGKGHGRREKRSIRTAPADGIDWPDAAQALRIRRDTGPSTGPWASKEIAYGITSLPADLAGPRHLAIYARQHWGVGEPRALRPRRHFPRGRPESQDREPARRLRRRAQPRHRRHPQGRIRQYRLRPPLLRTRRPAHPRPLRIRLKIINGGRYQECEVESVLARDAVEEAGHREPPPQQPGGSGQTRRPKTAAVSWG
jgi:predicted transposase YbfD/YdcC